MRCCDYGWIFGQMADPGLNPVMRLIDGTEDVMFECPGAVLPCTVDWVVWEQQDHGLIFEFLEKKPGSLLRLLRLRILVCPLESGEEAFVVADCLDRVVTPR